MRHMLAGRNIGLLTARSNKSSSPDHFFCSKLIVETKCGESTTQSSFFPLFLYADERGLAFKQGTQVNLSPAFLSAIERSVGLGIDISRAGNAENIFHYAYAVFHSPSYRSRYAEFLKIDFPRLPLTEDLELFRVLTRLGGELTALHLLESPKLDQPITEFICGGDPEVEKISWSTNTVWVDQAQTTGFKGVREDVWNFQIGGYQVCEKWLKDRKGRTLAKGDIEHYQKIVVSLNETIYLMKQIDEVIELRGGWPGAFSHKQSLDAGVEAHLPPVLADKAQQNSETSVGKLSKAVDSSTDKSLFDSDDDLDALAATSGAPPRPKAKATPAKAAGGKASTSSARVVAGKQAATVKAGTNGFTDWQAMCAIRAVLAREGPLDRKDLIRHTARQLAFARSSPRIATELASAIRRATRRGIAGHERGILSLLAKTIEGYDRDFLKLHLLGCVSGAWCDKADVPLRFARTLGFARTGPKIEALVWNLMRSLRRSGQVESEGRAASSRYRKSPP